MNFIPNFSFLSSKRLLYNPQIKLPEATKKEERAQTFLKQNERNALCRKLKRQVAPLLKG